MGSASLKRGKPVHFNISGEEIVLVDALLDAFAGGEEGGEIVLDGIPQQGLINPEILVNQKIPEVYDIPP
jgi:hypothetical protein